MKAIEDVGYGDLLARAAPYLAGLPSLQLRHPGHPDQSVHGKKGPKQAVKAVAKKAKAARPPAPKPASKPAGKRAPKPVPATPAKATTMSGKDGEAMQKRMLAGKPWTDEQRESLAHYSDEGYRQINAALYDTSGGKPDPADAQHVKNIHAAMRPTDTPVRVFRSVNRAGLGLGENDDLGGLVGRRFQNRGFSSTSLNRKMSVGAAEDSGSDVILEIDVPAGTPAAYLDWDFLSATHEQELLLGAGMIFEFVRTGKEQNGLPVVQARVVKT